MKSKQADPTSTKCYCQCHALGNFGWDQKTKECEHCKTSTTSGWEKKFDKKFYYSGMGNYKMDFNQSCDGLNTSWTNPQPRHFKDFIHNLLAEERKKLVEEIKESFSEIAVTGQVERDEVKGALLYTRFHTYLDTLLEREEKE